MPVLVRLPKLAANVVEASVGPWRKNEGDAVRAGEALVEIITSKATFDLESPADGVLLQCCAPTKSTIPVGYILASIGGPGETAPDVRSENARVLADFRAQAAAQAAMTAAAPANVRATPGARRLAKEAGVDLAQVAPAAGQDVVREEDVRAFLDRKRGS